MINHSEIEILIAKKIGAEQNSYQIEILGFWVQVWLYPHELESEYAELAAVRENEISDPNIRSLLTSIGELMPQRQHEEVRALNLGLLLKLVVLNAYSKNRPAATFKDAQSGLEMLLALALDSIDTMPLLPVAVAESIRKLRDLIQWKSDTLELGARFIARLNQGPAK